MPMFEVPPLPPGCPWSGYALPNLKWCEENLCAWVTAPANTWSNLGYILLGLLMWYQARSEPDPRLRIFGPASITVGVFSLLYHASYTYFFQFFDFVGMYVFCFVLIGLNWLRLGRIQESRLWPAVIGGVAISSASVPLLFHLGIPIQLTVAALIAWVLAQEWRLSRRKQECADYPLYAGALILMAIATTCSALDLSRVWCNPTNHWIQGHAVWHGLTACALYALFLFYRKLRPQSSPVPS